MHVQLASVHFTSIVSLTLKMLGLYLLGQKCLHHTFKPYLSSETYPLKYEKRPNIVIRACTNISEKVNTVKPVLSSHTREAQKVAA